MITNYFRLESGQEYSLKQLFNGKNRIVIPDLQRDYCWGDKAWNKDTNNYTELISGFFDSLLSAYNDNPNDNLTLGLIYGYESPHFHIQLCDGQQRITTLFLLMGMINRKTDNQFKDILISEAELADDKEPNLQYAIRESTLYFLSDLVCEFFLKNDVDVEDITKRDWYFKEYDLDASIQSMICAIKIIDSKLTTIDCDKFGEFISNNIQMLYYDMGHRTRGEETFVIINTTGEPLTATENLKPILIASIKHELSRKKAAKEWEDREEWFWKNRDKNEQTSDEAHKAFFIWYWQIRLIQEKTWKDKKPYTLNPHELFQKKPLVEENLDENPDISKWEESKNLDVLHKYFIALKSLLEKCKEENIEKVLKTIYNEEISLSWFRSSKVSLDVVLPLIAYVTKFENPKNLYQFIRRIRKNYFDKQLRERNFLDWRYIIQIINSSITEETILKFETINENNFKLIPNVALNEWYNDDEKNKDVLKIDYKFEIEQWEDHDELNGNLNILWEANGVNILNYDKISQYYQTFNILSSCLLEENSKANPILSNYFRLYKLLIGYPAIGHIDYCSWDMEGAWFSWRDIRSNDFIKYHSDEKIISLIKIAPSNLIIELETRIRSIVIENSLIDINEINFKVANHLKAWLFVKVLQANTKNELLSFKDGSGIASYKDSNQNKLNTDLGFSLANSICGYAIKNPANRIDYANQENWSSDIAIDTIIGDSISFLNFKNKTIAEEQILRHSNKINDLVNTFLNHPL
jgi:hypothetical protein